MHQDIQDRVFQEIKSAHSSQYSDTDAEAMTKLNYLEMVIRETMRLLPVGPFLARESLEDVKISKQGTEEITIPLIVSVFIGNCTIPKGASILLAFHVLHLDKSVWGPEPNKFNPDHFLPEKVAQRHPYMFLPFRQVAHFHQVSNVSFKCSDFSGGPRNCIGILSTVYWISNECRRRVNKFLCSRYQIRLDVYESYAVCIAATI